MMERLNPFSKAVTILLCGLMMSFRYSVLLSALTLGVCLATLLFASRVRPLTCFKVLAPALLLAVSLFFTGYFNSGTGAETAAAGNFALAAASSRSLYSGLQLGLRVLAFAALGALFALTSDGEEFVVSLIHQGHVSPKFAYGTLAAFHLLPDLKREYEDARLACRVRGLACGPFSLKPLFAALVNALRWSESVAMAMESKGFSDGTGRSYRRRTVLRPADWCFSGLCLAAMAAGVALCRW